MMKQCPHCAEWIQDEAKVCRYCQYNANDVSQPYSVPVRLEQQGIGFAGNVCPNCRRATAYVNTYSFWHGVIALFTFPIGLVILFFPVKKCVSCGQKFGAGYTVTRTIGWIVIAFFVITFLFWFMVGMGLSMNH